MVEPVPYVFARLRSNYEGIERVILENAAIADRDGALPFYYLREASADEAEALPDWYHGLGSLSAEALQSHARHIPNIEQRIVESLVPCMTFESLCERHSVDQVDLILVDTEGYDWEILSAIDLSRHRLRLIVYEHYHLEPADRQDCRAHLRELGFETMEEGFDTFCLDASVPDGLTRTWRSLRPAVAGVSAQDP